jgi:flagellar biosynthetic protein FlhB
VPISAVLEVVNDEVLGLLRTVAVAGLVMAAADYVIVRRRMGKKTRMSKHEVKQESKQTEGDPLLKGAIRSRQLAASRNRMMADVPTADVVLVNPTHVAVALTYDAERGAPRVVARGTGLVAQRIREQAAEHGVPLVRDIPLARALHRSTTVGQEIPAELYAAVAQVLAFVISRRSAGVGGGEHRSPRRERELPSVPVAGRRRRPASSVPRSVSTAPGANPSGVVATGR